MVSQPPSPDPVSQIQQDLQGDHNQAIGQIYGGIVVYVSGGQAIINPTAAERLAAATSSVADIGPNPYKGLLSFHEEDSANFFGRSRDIQHLWEQFRDLQNTAVRLLPVYGPSGSGKSSLVRSGLIPTLGQRPLPGRDRARVAVLVPGTQPLQALATVLARIAENDLTPVKKTREFAEELELANKAGQYDGLQRIASALPEIGTVPVIVMVDQFEEVYSLCKDAQERDTFIANLLYAAADRSAYVSVILTMRSDLLGETQKHSALNRLFSSQGFLVPTMDADCLREAIAQPAEQAGHPLDIATVNLLIEQTEGREGALPLLQFALTRIWEGLRQREAPAVALERIGGVGGALAGEAQQIYESLSLIEQQIARRAFLRLVQLGDVIKYTRCRAVIASLVSPLDTAEQVNQIIGKFAAPGVRLITLSTQADGETAEITHEALFSHWQLLRDWLEDNRLFLTWQDHLRSTIRQWEMSDRDPETLLRGKPLAEAEDWLQKQETDLTQIEQTYIQSSLAERNRMQKTEEARLKRELSHLEQLLEKEEKARQAESKARKAAQMRTRFAIATTVLAIIASVIGGVALQWQQSLKFTQVLLDASLDTITPEVAETLLKSLPDFLKQANEYRDAGDVDKALAYYRKVSLTTSKLQKKIFSDQAEFQNLLSRQPDVQSISEKSTNSIVELIRKYRLPQLQSELNSVKPQIGKRVEHIDFKDFEKRFTVGALQTTYKILMQEFGAGADFGGNGELDSKEEAEQIPCQTFKDIEKIWREATKQRCGWYGKNSDYLAQDTSCRELDGFTLTNQIFNLPFDSAILDRLESCHIASKLNQKRSNGS